MQVPQGIFYIKDVLKSKYKKGAAESGCKGIMKITNKAQVDKFVNAIEQCQGKTFLFDTQGNQYNLKSFMSRQVALGKLLDKDGDNLELFCERREDELHFMKFFREYPTVLRPQCTN